MCGGVHVVLLLVQLPRLFELRQLALEHVGGRRHRGLGGQQGGDDGALLGLVLAPSDTLLLGEETVGEKACWLLLNTTKEQHLSWNYTAKAHTDLQP